MILELIMQSSEAYSAYAGVALTSYLENNKNINEIIIYFIADNLSIKSKKKLIDTVERYERKIYFFEANMIVNDLRAKGFRELHGSYTTYCKIFLLDKINFKSDKALYVDADTLCVGNLEDILEIKWEETYICGMSMNLEPYVEKIYKVPNYMQWYNAGVVLFNVEEWKRKNCSEMVCDYIAECTPNIIFAEQDILNILFEGEIKELPIIYNYMYSYALLPLKYGAKIFGWNSNIMRQMILAPSKVKIYHCFPVFAKRPWHKDAYIPDNRADWDKYLKLSMWKELEKVKKESIINKIQYWMYQKLPVLIYSILYGGVFRLLIHRSAIKNNLDYGKEMERAAEWKRKWQKNHKIKNEEIIGRVYVK